MQSASIWNQMSVDEIIHMSYLSICRVLENENGAKLSTVECEGNLKIYLSNIEDQHITELKAPI